MAFFILDVSELKPERQHVGKRVQNDVATWRGKQHKEPSQVVSNAQFRLSRTPVSTHRVLKPCSLASPACAQYEATQSVYSAGQFAVWLALARAGSRSTSGPSTSGRTAAPGSSCSTTNREYCFDWSNSEYCVTEPDYIQHGLCVHHRSSTR